MTGKPEQKAFELVPPGLYNARLADAKVAPGSLCLVFEITDGPQKGQKIFRAIHADDQTNVQIEIKQRTNKDHTESFVDRFTYGLPPAGK